MAVDTKTDVAALRDRVKQAIENERGHVVEVAETIRVNPELGYEERMASQLLADHLKEAGFEVEKPYKGIETAFRATRRGKGDGPTIAVLAEYDALAGIGHGCGHNLIGGSGLAAALGLAPSSTSSMARSSSWARRPRRAAAARSSWPRPAPSMTSMPR